MRLKVKQLILVISLLLAILLLLKIKYLVLVIQSKKTDCNTKCNEIEKKLTDRNLDKYIDSTEFNRFTAETFDSRFKEEIQEEKNDIANFVNKTDFDNQVRILHQIKMNQMNYRKKLKQYQQKD